MNAHAILSEIEMVRHGGNGRSRSEAIRKNLSFRGAAATRNLNDLESKRFLPTILLPLS